MRGETTQLAQKPSAGHPTQGQPEDVGRPALPQITRERDPSPNGLPSQPTGVDDKPRCVPQENDNSGSSTEHLAKFVAPDTSSEKETERDQHIARLTDQLVQKSALLEQAEGEAAETKKHARLELRELQAKLGELMLSRDENLRTLEQTQSALQKATSRAADADERIQPACEHETELAEVRTELEGKKSELEAVRLRLTDAENLCAEADTLRASARTAASPINTDVDRFMNRLMERMRTMGAEIASLRGNEKSIEEMECRNEG